MEAVQQMTMPYALVIFGLIVVGLVMLALCAFAWWLVNRIVGSEIRSPVIYGSYEQDAELRAKYDIRD